MLDAVGLSPVNTSPTSRSLASASSPKHLAGGVSLLDETNRLLADKAEDYASRTAAVNDAVTQRPTLDKPNDLASVTVSRSEFSAAQRMGELDMNTGVDSIGGPMELVERAVEQMAELGQTAVLAQANQLPQVAMAGGE